MATTQLMTVDRFEELHVDDRVELIDEEVHDIAPPSEGHGAVAREIIWRIENYIRPRAIEQLFLETSFAINIDRHTALVPDIAFVHADRLNPERDTWKLVRTVPDLVIEVISPTDRPGLIKRKTQHYLIAGVRLVVFIDPIRRSASISRPGIDEQRLTGNDELDMSDIIPGLSIPLASVLK